MCAKGYRVGRCWVVKPAHSTHTFHPHGDNEIYRETEHEFFFPRTTANSGEVQEIWPSRIHLPLFYGTSHVPQQKCVMDTADLVPATSPSLRSTV